MTEIVEEYEEYEEYEEEYVVEGEEEEEQEEEVITDEVSGCLLTVHQQECPLHSWLFFTLQPKYDVNPARSAASPVNNDS